MTTPALSALRRAWHRSLLDYPGQVLLSVTGIALGIAVVVSIDLAKQSALEAFVQATETLSGKASYRIVGRSGFIDETLYPKLRLGDLPLRFLPKIEGYVRIDRPSGEKIRILGIDPLAETGFGSVDELGGASLSNRERRNLKKILTRPDHVLIARTTAERLELKSDRGFDILGGGRKKTLKIAALIGSADPVRQQAMEDLILTDIASAQEILAMGTRITYIDVVARDREIDRADLRVLQRRLPNDVELIPYRRITENADTLTASFYTNLTALSLLSVMVGMFLIYNTINFLTLRRRALIGMLRALGTSRTQIFQLVVSEAAMLGVAGTLAGLLLGAVLAVGLLDLIGDTIHNVYFDLPNPHLRLSPPAFLKGLFLGTLVSVMTAIPPANEAIATKPFHALARSNLESNTRRTALIGSIFGLFALGAGIVTTLLSGKSVAFGFAGLMLLVFGCALLTPFFLERLSRTVYPISNKLFGVLPSLPLRSVNANLSRSGLAVAALMVAISATIGVRIMVTSFRDSVNAWLEQRLNADLYITAPASAPLTAGPLNDAYAERISRLQGVRAIGTVRRRMLQGGASSRQLVVYRLTPELTDGFHFIAGKPDEIWTQLASSDTVIVSESYAYNHLLQPGGVIELVTDHGPVDFSVSGVYTDYNPGSGVIAMSHSTYRRHWQDTGYSGISVYTAADTDLKRLQHRLLAMNESDQVLEITERKTILEASMSVFDQAFAVTNILQWLAATIAFLGVFSVLTAIQLDRVREYGVLRAIGLTAKQLGVLIVAESGLMGAIAGLIAIPVGMLIALVLVYVINQRSFGWSMGFHVLPETILQGIVSGIIAAVLAGLIPAYRMSRTITGEALRND